MPDEKGQWYTNRDLFERISEMQTDFHDLRSEMRETRSLMRQYNGLREELGVIREDVDDVGRRMSDMEARAEGRNSVGSAIREWGGWIIAVITFILLLV